MGIDNQQKLTRAKKTPGYTGGGLLHVIKELNETDVLLGRGTGPSEHKGNREFRYLIAKRTNEFNSTDNRQTKSKIAEQTVKDVKAENGRFLRRLDKSEYRFISDKTSASELDDVLYIQVDDVTAVLKTKQAFRYCSRTATATTTTSPRAVAVAPPTMIGGIIPSRVRDPVTAAAALKDQQDKKSSSSLLAATMPPLRQVLVYEQLKAAEMEIKSAAIIRRMWQNELLAQQQQQQEHQARLVTSSLLAPRSRYFLGQFAPTNAVVDPSSRPPLLSSSCWEDEMMLRASAISSQPPRSMMMGAPGAGGGGGAELLLSLLDQQVRSSAAVRMQRGCAPPGHGFDLSADLLLQPRQLTASAAPLPPPPRAGNVVHPVTYR